MNVRNAAMLPLLVGLLGISGMALNVTGVWRGQVTDPEGTAHELTVKLKADSNKLTGTVTVSPAPDEQPILNGKIDGDRVSFQLARKSGGTDSARLTFTAQVVGNRMQGTVIDPRGQQIPFTLMRVQPGSPEAAPSTRRADTTGSEPPHPVGPDPGPEDAQRAILAAFDHYQIVGGLGVTNKEPDEFLLALIRNPAFPAKVNDIAVECGNSLYQPILDRYIAGENVPLAAVRQVWRNTTQPNCGFSAFYEELFPLVRRINERLPSRQRLRILACDPPIDWSKVRTADDLRSTMDRDRNIAAVIETEVLAKHRKVLMPFGINHMRHGTSAMGMIERQYPGVAFIVADYHGFGGFTALARYNDELEKRMASWPMPLLVMMQGTWLADLPSGYFDSQFELSQRRGYPGVDALLYFGSRDLLLQEPISAAIALDTVYMAELQRRLAIKGRPNDSSSPAKVLQRESESGVFLYEPPAKTSGGH